jgi:hypothetical protein
MPDLHVWTIRNIGNVLHCPSMLQQALRWYSRVEVGHHDQWALAIDRMRQLV